METSENISNEIPKQNQENQPEGDTNNTQKQNQENVNNTNIKNDQDKNDQRDNQHEKIQQENSAKDEEGNDENKNNNDDKEKVEKDDNAHAVEENTEKINSELNEHTVNNAQQQSGEKAEIVGSELNELNTNQEQQQTVEKIEIPIPQQIQEPAPQNQTQNITDQHINNHIPSDIHPQNLPINSGIQQQSFQFTTSNITQAQNPSDLQSALEPEQQHQNQLQPEQKKIQQDSHQKGKSSVIPIDQNHNFLKLNLQDQKQVDYNKLSSDIEAERDQQWSKIQQLKDKPIKPSFQLAHPPTTIDSVPSTEPNIPQQLTYTNNLPIIEQQRQSMKELIQPPQIKQVSSFDQQKKILKQKQKKVTQQLQQNQQLKKHVEKSNPLKKAGIALAVSTAASVAGIMAKSDKKMTALTFIGSFIVIYLAQNITGK